MHPFSSCAFFLLPTPSVSAYFRRTALYHRIARRRGKKRAIIAVAHSLLVTIYHMLRDNKPYQDLGADYLEKQDSEQIQRRAVMRLQQLGYEVSLTPKKEVA